MKITKETYLNEIIKYQKLFGADRNEKYRNLFGGILRKHQGRYSLPKSISKKTLEKIYEDLVNCVSDNKIA